MVNYTNKCLRSKEVVENSGIFLIFLAGTILLDLLFRFSFSKYLKNKTENMVFYSDFSQKLVPIISKIIYITGVYFAVSSLDLMEGTQASFSSIYMVLMFIMTAWLIFRLIACLGHFLSDRMIKNENTEVTYFVPLVTRTLNIAVAVVFGVLLLQKLGYNITSVLAGLGITGLAIGFAAKETLSDILGSFIVILDNVFKIGDMIIIDASVGGENVQGVVEDISLFSTKIRALDHSVVIISNHRISGMTVKNLSRRQKTRINEKISIAYTLDSQKIEKAVEICREVARNHPQIEDGFNIYFTELAEGSIKIFFNAYALTSDFTEYLEIREELFFAIKKAFDAEKIQFSL